MDVELAAHFFERELEGAAGLSSDMDLSEGVGVGAIFGMEEGLNGGQFVVDAGEECVGEEFDLTPVIGV
jgi:hypothetical protein